MGVERPLHLWHDMGVSVILNRTQENISGTL